MICFWLLPLRLSGSIKEVLSLGLIILHYEGRIFWVSYPTIHELWSCLVLLSGKGSVSCPMWTLGIISFVSFFIFLMIHLFLVSLSLHWCSWALSSCSEQGLLFLAMHGLLILVASLVTEYRLKAPGFQQLWYTGPASPQHVESPKTRDQTCVPRICRWILIYYITREVLFCLFLIVLSYGSSGKESTCNMGDLGSIPESERSAGEGKG